MAKKQEKTDAINLDIKPMLATLIAEPFEDTGWIYEVKWDGYRAISSVHQSKVEIRSRNNKDFNLKFYPIYESLQRLKQDVILDGEIVVIDENGKPDFSALQNWRSESDGNLLYYVFDVLYLDGKSLLDKPLIYRRSVLKKLLKNAGPLIRFSDDFDVDVKDLFSLVKQLDIEGIMAKRSDSKYIPGARSKDWLKIKTEKRQEAIIGGYTINENTSKPFSALLLGLFENNSFVSVGTVGTGFSIKQQQDLIGILRPLETTKSPFKVIPEFNKPSRFRPNPPKADVVWVKPKIVCEISYRELTSDNVFRHPSYKGLRPDKTAKEVIREIPKLIVSTGLSSENTKLLQKPEMKERKSLLNPSEDSQVKKLGKQELKFSNLSKIYWPEDKITKRDLLNYYYQAAPYILPFIKDRPQTLNRYPNGIHGKAFYQKDVKGKVPGWIDTFPYFSVADNRDKEFFICNDEESLLYLVSLGCIEINPWSSRKANPEYPDWCIIDLDPDKNSFNQVIEVAKITKQLLDTINITGYCKTSGSTGLHIYIPLGAKYTYEQSKEFARALATWIHNQVPEYTSIERQTKNRGGKMYIDFLQNRPQATVASVYSVRPKAGATVSMPLLWEEVKPGLKISDFTIKNSVARIREAPDMFKGVTGKGINIPKSLKLLKAL